MASINGVSIKKLTEFLDHEGLTIFQGNVYIDNKLQGSWSQDYMCGPDIFRFNDDELAKRAMAFSKGVPVDDVQYHSIYEESGILLYLLTKLMDDEKEFKKAFKAGYVSIAIVDDKMGSVSVIKSREPIDEKMLQRFDGFKGRDDYRIYNSLDDFNIVVNENNPAPKFIYKE